MGTKLDITQIPEQYRDTAVEVRFGYGSGGDRNYLMPNNFTLVDFSNLSGYFLEDVGSNWSASGNYYTVSKAGIYKVTTKLRVTDSVASELSYGQGADISLGDSAVFMWFETLVYRNGSLNIRISHFDIGDQICMQTFGDKDLTLDNVVDDMEYATDEAAQAAWSGTGVTVSHTTDHAEGDYALQCVIDATGNRTVNHTLSSPIDLSSDIILQVLVKPSIESATFQIKLVDGNANEYTYPTVFTTEPFIDDWYQTFYLSLLENTSVDLSNITAISFVGLNANCTYKFDMIQGGSGYLTASDGSMNIELLAQD
jgi:hypothetical protein